MMLIGLGLGALGGMLAGPGGERDLEIYLLYQITGVGGALTAGLVLFVTTVVQGTWFTPAAVADAAAKNNIVPDYPPNIIVILPAVLLFILMMASQAAWWIFYKQGRAACQRMDTQVRMSAMTLLIVPIVTGVLLGLVYHAALFYMLYLLLLAVSILIGWLIRRDVWANSEPEWNKNLTFCLGMISTA